MVHLLDGIVHCYHFGSGGCSRACGALVAIVQAINLLIGLSAVPNEWYWSYGMLIILSVIFFCIPPGRTFSASMLRCAGVSEKRGRAVHSSRAWCAG